MPNRLTGSLQGSCQTRPRAGLSPDIDRALGEIAVRSDYAWRRSVRWVSAYSTVFPEFAPGAE